VRAENHGPVVSACAGANAAEKSSFMPRSIPTATAGFHRFGLHESLLRGIRATGFVDPRPIQSGTIPAGLEGRDILGLAQTGTGKTAAFALPLLHRLLQSRTAGPRVLVLAPTRELASQIHEEVRSLARHTAIGVTTVYGGVPIARQVHALRQQPESVVGCPGRVLDLLQQRILRLDRIEALVLDEADHMFDMGFLRDIRKILRALPERRQNLLFSATMPREIRALADELLSRPHVVELATAAPASTIDHALYSVAEGRKRALLEVFLSDDRCDSAIVFTRTKRRAKTLADQLKKAGHRAVGLQGNMSQNARDRAMSGFRTRRFDVLVATDIVARGIDVSGVSHVINFDVPNTPEAYTHRIGRTGRAECEGVACTFVTAGDADWVRATERMIGAAIQRREVAGFDSAVPRARPVPAPARRTRTGRGTRTAEARTTAAVPVAAVAEKAAPPSFSRRRRRSTNGGPRGRRRAA